MPSVESGNNRTGFNHAAVGWGILAATLILTLGSALLGILFYLTDLSERSLPWFSAVLYFFSVVTGALLAAKKAGRRSLFHGLGVALLFFIFISLTGLFLSPGVALPTLVKKFFLTLGAGCLGSILALGLT